ncbi:hypothetical protein FRB94_000094 [Tulasnella sp. JGI-2019a]|nr:hypothetical protein FRB94_000094 [Tulasnella sp. JGI-2019a]KAG9015778.1 hypothetical protein FRB93_012343 [Tulasnella sp. JGI-2019a]KAG9039589.1 hypothetical protein FRB95_009169 [Tulasnella sp. JGI-2019a]
MSSRYAPVPTTSQQDEMNAAFDDSDDEGEHLHSNNDRAPLLSQQRSSSAAYHPLENELDSPDSPIDTRRSFAASAPAPPVPGSYNFEFDYPPPPGSPPITAYGNSNGTIPIGPVLPVDPRPNFLKRALGAILPTHYTRDPRGGGIGNDGVFANMSARPGGAVPARDTTTGGVHFAPEEVQKEAPPSYASAQADAVPPYWETTVMAPNTPHADGELVVDGLTTGSFFSFMWNLLVSMSFQFVGFLLTYLLHTTHAAKFGSRAGLGVTLIQYGFYLRSRMDMNDADVNDQNIFGFTPPEPKPSFATAEDAARYYGALNETLVAPWLNHNNVTDSTPSAADVDMSVASAANEWLAFFLMTVGWFVLITAVLGFWRVKRWERGVRQAAYEAANPRPPPTEEELERERAVLSSIEQAFGMVGLLQERVNDQVLRGAEQVRHGLGIPLEFGDEQEEAGERDRLRFQELTRQ